MKTNSIRNAFLNFFQRNGHEIMKSSPLIPHHDPSLMFTNSGMVQFKNWFTGFEHSRFSRVTTAQKCLRAGGKHNDLENVGYTARHHTFFEMLGNFSFGDYFKEQAIYYAWQLITREFSINPDKLYITVYSEDDEAYNIWHKITGFDSNKILRIATSDNFWSMGETGPCGPCSEIFFDHGAKYQGGLPGTAEQDGDRYTEIWNLVFMQYEQLADKTKIKLPRPSIDTGMGIERIAAVLQGVNDNFLIDSFQHVIQASQEISGNINDLVSHKVIADHLRSSVFLIADGVIPSNEGRGYVLRRIMRRAMRHVHHLGYNKAMLHQLAPILIEEMGTAYSETVQAKQTILSVLKLEEERFSETLDKGIKILKQNINDMGSDKIMSGQVAFKLYDTYGFPLDLTKDILRSHRLEICEKEFEVAMNQQKAIARASWVGSGEHSEDKIWFDLYERHGATEFLGYETDETEAIIISILVQGKEVDKLEIGQEGIIILNHTPFYGESGGQVGDIGKIIIFANHLEKEENFIEDFLEIIDTQVHHKIFAHYAKASVIKITVGDKVKARIDKKYRQQVRSHHSATHLLHYALRKHLGDHVTQKGSLVSHDKLRFDFVHNKGLTFDEIKEIEKTIQTMIMQNDYTDTRLMEYTNAIKEGAMALFGEKYSDDVRVISIGASIELCGGTHVKRTGDIGIFKILSEEAIASGVRRIEAITGLTALEYFQNSQMQIDQIAGLIKCNKNDLKERIQKILIDKKNLDKKLEDIKIDTFLQKIENKKVENISINYIILQNLDNQLLKKLMDKMKIDNSDIQIIINEIDNKIMLMIGVNKSCQNANANTLLAMMTKKFGGKGGGNKELSQAGGISCNGLDLINHICQAISKQV